MKKISKMNRKLLRDYRKSVKSRTKTNDLLRTLARFAEDLHYATSAFHEAMQVLVTETETVRGNDGVVIGTRKKIWSD